MDPMGYEMMCHFLCTYYFSMSMSVLGEWCLHKRRLYQIWNVMIVQEIPCNRIHISTNNNCTYIYIYICMNTYTREFTTNIKFMQNKQKYSKITYHFIRVFHHNYTKLYICQHKPTYAWLLGYVWLSWKTNFSGTPLNKPREIHPFAWLNTCTLWGTNMESWIYTWSLRYVFYLSSFM